MTMDIAHLEAALTERSLTVVIHQRNNEREKWVVWLTPVDDPALGTWVGEGDTLELAIANALAEWDNSGGTEVIDPSLPGTPPSTPPKGESN